MESGAWPHALVKMSPLHLRRRQNFRLHCRICPRRRLGHLYNRKQFDRCCNQSSPYSFQVPRIYVIFCEAVAIYGFIVAIILQTKLESVPKSQIYAPESLRAGYAIFASGIIVGFLNLVCGFFF
ncbi:uncharacterized protein LOC115950847 isoform X2 [Quercus lobata]|uniref:uncharacterized protein LOC115950847 isoform X2 n=1 Tax=Quercus lobata TaxID=97700 RepID=UPI0012461ADF|nr:uncharacterized protein LOC115950847 isoform X2 [Quercus lobata]